MRAQSPRASQGRPRISVDRWELPFRTTAQDDLAHQWQGYARELLTAAFGRRPLPSPAHGPVLLDRKALARVIDGRWRGEFARTSALRFRTGRLAMPHVLYMHWLAARRGCDFAINSPAHNAFVMSGAGAGGAGEHPPQSAAVLLRQ